MILRKSRKRSLSRAPEVYKKRHNSIPSHFSTSRSVRTNYKNKNGAYPISLDKNTIPDRIRDIDQQMKELFILDTKIDEFSSSLKSSLLSVSNTKSQNSTGETFFTFWNSYVQSITSYLRQPTVNRCLNYVVFYFKQSKEITSSLFSQQNFKSISLESRTKAKIEKYQSDINNSVSELQQLINNAVNDLKNNSSDDDDDISSETESQIISQLSNMTYPFDCFYHEIKSKYAVFLETVLPEKNSREVQISTLSKSIKNIVDCTFSASKLDDLKMRFIQNLNDSTDIFNQIFKRPAVKNFSSTEKISHSHRNRSFYPPESKLTKDISQNRNKTEVYFRENEKPPHNHNNSQKRRIQSDESSSGIDNIITIDEPSESITDDIKISQKPQINRVMMTLSKTKYDHLNRKFNNSGEVQQPQTQHTQQQHSKNSQKQQNHQNSPNNQNSTNNSPQVNLMTKQNSKRASSTTSQGTPSSCPNRIRPNSFINHNSNNNNNNSSKTNNSNSSSKKNSPNIQKGDIMAQIYMSRGKEAQLLAQIEQISQQNDQLRQKRDQLAEILEKSRQDSKIDALNREISVLKNSLEQMKTENAEKNGSSDQQLEIELVGEVQTLRELVDSIKETNGLLVDEVEPCQQINSGLLSPIDLDDTTVNFDNVRLRKACDEMKEKLRKRSARLEEFRKQNKKSLMISEIYNGQQLSNDEKIAVFNFVNIDSRLNKRDIKRLEKRLSRYQESISASIDKVQNKNNGEINQYIRISFAKDHNTPLRKLISRINQLEEKINFLRKSQNGVYTILVDQLFKMKSACVEIKRLDNEISQKIDKYSQISENVQIKRKVFDVFEVYKEKSRDLKIRYSALKSSITNQMTTSQRYDIELQMDDIQDLFTCVMMEIERIGNQMTASQEGLKECRKDRSKMRREMKKYMDQEYQVASESLEAEKRVFNLETEVSILMSKDNNLNVDKDDLYISKIADALAESAQTKEIINLINEQAKEFNLELEPNQVKTEKQRIEDLKETVEKLINNGGPKMRQKLRIYNLKKEIESYHS